MVGCNHFVNEADEFLSHYPKLHRKTNFIPSFLLYSYQNIALSLRIGRLHFHVCPSLKRAKLEGEESYEQMETACIFSIFISGWFFDYADTSQSICGSGTHCQKLYDYFWKLSAVCQWELCTCGMDCSGYVRGSFHSCSQQICPWNREICRD